MYYTQPQHDADIAHRRRSARKYLLGGAAVEVFLIVLGLYQHNNSTVVVGSTCFIVLASYYLCIAVRTSRLDKNRLWMQDAHLRYPIGDFEDWMAMDKNVISSCRRLVLNAKILEDQVGAVEAQQLLDLPLEELQAIARNLTAQAANQQNHPQ